MKLRITMHMVIFYKLFGKFSQKSTYISMQIKKQTDINDCGLVVLQALHKYFHNSWISINELKSRAYMNDKGINISNLIRLGEKYGIKLEAFEGEIDNLYNSKSKDYFVTLIKTKETYHYVIIKVKDKYVNVIDPIKGKFRISKSEFSKLYQNVIITVSEIPYEKKNFEKISGLLFKDPVIIFTLLTTILISIVITFSSSIYMKIIIDKVIPRKLNRELIVISLIFIWLAFVKSFNLFIKKYFSRKLTINVNQKLTFIYINKISNANLNELDKIAKSDHLRRLFLIDSVSGMLSNLMFIIFGDTIMLFTSIGILFWISTRLFSVVLITAAISLSISVTINLFVKEEYSNTINHQQKYFASSVEIINSYEKLKNSNYKTYSKNKFRKNYFLFKNSESKIYWLKTSSAVWELIIDSIAPIVITFIATKSVFSGELTIGSMIMFISLFRTFLHPLDSIANTLLNIPLGLKNLNLLKYILMLEDEKLNQKGFISKPVKKLKFKNIDFGFDRTIFQINSFEINDDMHISGKNGIGKTNFMKLISSRYDFKGKYFVNNIEIPFLNKQNLRDRIYYSNEKFIPDITIFEFITLLDPYKAKILSQNIEKFNLNKLFEKLQLDLSKTLKNNGSNVSGGQLQVIKLLRLLTKKYDIILLDEDTDNITNDILKILSKAIKTYQDGIFIEVSHNNKFISKGRKVDFEKIINY